MSVSEVPKRFLDTLPDGASAVVERLVATSPDLDAGALRRLGDIGFIPGEPVKVVRRGPGGREPLAVVIGQTMFALRLVEARCVEVSMTATSSMSASVAGAA